MQVPAIYNPLLAGPILYTMRLEVPKRPGMKFLRGQETDRDAAVSPEANPGPLSRQMAQSFNLDDLRILSFNLGVDYEELAGQTKTPKMTSLIWEMQQQNRLPELLAQLERERPHIDWQRPAVPTNRDLRNRGNVLRNIQSTWIEGFLHNSLSQAVALELDLTYEPTAVARKTVYVPGQGERPVEGDIGQVFEDYGRALLILGDPGSGKTITLLQLAEALITEAQNDPGQPIPAVLNLSSWGESHPTLVDWLVEEIFVQYGVARKVSRTWIEQNQWLYLLDGLDEVNDEAREACVEAINAFRAEHPAEIVVCSRVKDYEELSLQLNLGTAVRIQPLSDGQIQRYLGGSEGGLTAVGQALTTNRALKEQAHSPLFLNIMTVALQSQAGHPLPSFRSKEERDRHLFATYVDEIFARRPVPKNGGYSREQALQWLSYLARGMKKHDQSVFYLERLQPTWLPGISSFIYLLLVGFVCGALLGILNGFVSLAIFDVREALLAGVIFAAAGGISVAIGVGVSAMVKFAWLRALISGAVSWVLFALLVVLFAAILRPFDLGTGNSLPEWLLIGFFRGWNALLFAALIAYKANIETVERITIARPTGAELLRALRIGLIVGGFLGLIIGLTFGTSASVIYNVTVRQDVGGARGLFVGLIWGMCITFVALFLGAFLGAGLATVNALLQRSRIERKLRPNQGISNSLRSAVSLLLLATLPLILLMGIDYILSGRFARVVVVASWILPAVLLYFGGLAFIQHYCLRFMLILNKVLPVRVVSTFDDMGDRILLRLVGGGWVFIHRALMEYFASQ